MVVRKKIALLYNYDENWIGGTYYISNLIHALKQLEDSVKPTILLICDDKEKAEALQKEHDYPYLQWRFSYPEPSLPKRIINSIIRPFIKKNLFENRLQDKDLDVFYPAKDCFEYALITKKLYWIPDFQEHYLPNFFSDSEIKLRKLYQENIAINEKNIIFSSQCALKDFRKIYPSQNAQTFVLNFAVAVDEDLFSKELILGNYNISQKYFICSNQFWKHKNHFLVLKALNYLNQNNKTVPLIVFTGKPNDPRSPGFYNELLDYVRQNNLEDYTRFLGFIPRKDQLSLMKYSEAVVQPSLFEGWGTVVEDAKSLGKFILASAIEIHKEQITEDCYYFSPTDEKDLAQLFDKEIKSGSKRVYSSNVVSFGKDFLSIVEKISSSN